VRGEAIFLRDGDDGFDDGFVHGLIGDGRPLLICSALFLVACGAFAIFQAATGHLLPHDAAYLGMSATQLCALQGCRILHFMIHDRISFGGVLVGIGTIYLWLTLFPLRQRQAWAWWTLALSGAAGFLSFLAYLGYGYLDTWHGAGTLVLLPLFVLGMIRARRLRGECVAPVSLNWHSGPAVGRVLLLLSGLGIAVAGLTIMAVGMTWVFVPQDLEFMGLTREAINAINPHLVSLIAHDRAGFGGALMSFGIAMSGCMRYAQPSRALWQALAIAGTCGFATAIGIHPVIGYLSVSHLAPAVFGCAVFGVGLILASRS
jgi:hypothetical protein